MTIKAARFLEANKRSPVVYGSVITDPRRKDPGGAPLARGVHYRLLDGSTFQLTRKDLEHVPAARWLLAA